MFDIVKRRFLDKQMMKLFTYIQDPAGTDFTSDGNTTGTPEERAENLILEMTLDEKIAYVGGFDNFAIQGIPRLNIPYIWASDATSGVRCFGSATAFPANILLTATWNRDLIKKVGNMIADEARAQGISILLGPGVNIARVPTCGRNFEYMGEDPYLAGEMAASYIRGAQDGGVMTTVKHFVCNNSDYDRHKSDSIVDERTLREIYLPAFRKAVIAGGSKGVMSSYNPVNGTYASENSYLLNDILRKEWGFDGFVMSDWNSLYSTTGPILNGLDVEMPKGKWLSAERIGKSLKEGSIAEVNLDNMIRHILTSSISMGIFDRTMIDAEKKTNSDEAAFLALKAVEEGIVLLKNTRSLVPKSLVQKSLLPLSVKKVKHVVVMGRNGLQAASGGGGSSYVNPSIPVPGMYESLRKFLPEEISVEYIETKKGKIFKKDREIVKQADVVIIATGFDKVNETETLDRSWKIPDNESTLIFEAARYSSSVVVVLNGGGDMETGSWVDSVPAVLHSFYTGQAGAVSVVDILFGKVNPSGKLPFTMTKKWDDIAAAANYVKKPGEAGFRRILGGQGNPNFRKVTKMEYKEGLMVGYRHFDTNSIEPEFPFGHGLSYTTFSCISASIPSKKILKSDLEGEGVDVAVTIKNNGGRAGSETVQLYVTDCAATVVRPQKELKGFEKVFLKRGESKDILLHLDWEAFSFYSTERKCWYVEPGDFEILVGFSSRDIKERVQLFVAES